MAASSRAQFFSLYPVLKIQPTIARQITKNPSVIAEANCHAHVGRFVEAPAESADQIDDRIEQR